MKNRQNFFTIAVLDIAGAPISLLRFLAPVSAPSPSNQLPSGEQPDLIRVGTPQVNATVESPVVIEGEARGNWYFEASFPVAILDANGQELGRVAAEAQGEWMTTEFVPFVVTLTFAQPTTDTGTLILEKSNPSGLPEHAAEVRIPIRFSPPVGLDKCRPTGCSGQVCADENVVTTCEFKSEYACYKSARCEEQANGKCGWTETPELLQCLEDARSGGEGLTPVL